MSQKPVDQKVVDLANKIKPALKPLVDTNGVAVVPKDFYKQFITTDVTPEQITAGIAARNTYIAAQALALGEIGNELFAGDKNLKAVSVSTAWGDTQQRDLIEQQVNRSKEQFNPLSKETTTVYNNLESKVVLTGVKGSGALMVSVKKHLGSLGKEANS
jgi:hypothetical protein